MSAFVHPDDIRSRFSAALSALYRAEVPQYGDLLTLVADINAEALKADASGADRLAASGELARLSEERHGAIRVGTADELATIAPRLRRHGDGAGQLLQPGSGGGAGSFHRLPPRRSGRPGAQSVPGLLLPAAAGADRGRSPAGRGGPDPGPPRHLHPRRARTDRDGRARRRAGRGSGRPFRRRTAGDLPLARRGDRQRPDLRPPGRRPPADRRRGQLQGAAHQPSDPAHPGHRRGPGGHARTRHKP